MSLIKKVKIGLSSEDKQKMKNEVIEEVNKNYDAFEEEVKESITEVKETLSGLGQLKPSGTSLESNILAFTENKGIWIATDTGHWYYFDELTNSYTDGGVYQATELADGSINESKLDSNLQEFLNNINDSYPNELKTDTQITKIDFYQGAVDYATGEETNSDKRIRSDYIEIGKGYKITWKENSSQEAWYRVFDENKVLLTNASPESNGSIKVQESTSSNSYDFDIDKILTILPNAKYVRAVICKKDQSVIIPSEAEMVVLKNVLSNKKLEEYFLPLKEFEITLERDGLNTANGLYYDRKLDYVYQRARTPKFIKIGLNSTINFSYDDEREINLFEYDETFNFIKYTTVSSGSFQVSSKTKYIKFSVEGNEGEVIDLTKTLKINAYEEVFNIDKKLGTWQSYIDFYYSISDKEPHITRGFLMLPSNYSPYGKKIPLIVFIHGSADIGKINSENITSHYIDYYTYLRDNGYAIFDCYGWGDKYSEYTNENWFTNTWNTPTNINCYCSGIEYVCDRYNIDINKVFVACKSLGGINAVGMAYQNRVPIKAIGCLSPEISFLTLKLGYHDYERRIIIKDLGFTDEPNNILSDDIIDDTSYEYKNYIRENASKIAGYEPFFNNWLIPITNKLDKFFSDRYYINSTVLNAECKYCSVPLKIWIATDDEAVAYKRVENYIEMCLNGGSKAELRTFEAGLGGHHAVDNHENAPKVESITTPLGITHSNVPLAYVELIEYFEKYR